MNYQLNNIKDLPAYVSNYLCKYGLTGWNPELSSGKKFNNIVVIPAIQEYENIQRLLLSLGSSDKRYFNESLFLFVINYFKSSSEDVKENNLKSINFLRNVISKESKEDSFTDLNIGIIDVSTARHEMPEKEGGVGFARKMGMDTALGHFDYLNNKKKIIISLDADCTVESNYLKAIVEAFNSKNLSAAYVQYEHPMPDNEQEKRAIICYEIFLRYYALGLKYACSKYAFPTIGSTIICDCESFIKVGGMNNKKAAEDFYFLEKLAKITDVEKIADTKVYPSSRISNRVPFGTGQRIKRFQIGTHDEYILYDPRTFRILKDWLEIFNSKNVFNAEEYLKAAEVINTSLKEFLIMNNFQQSWNKILNNSKSEIQVQKQKNIWFDGFRTLKLIHYLRDNGYPPVNMFRAIDELVKIGNYPSVAGWRNLSAGRQIENEKDLPPISIQLEYLYLLRALT